MKVWMFLGFATELAEIAEVWFKRRQFVSFGAWDPCSSITTKSSNLSPYIYNKLSFCLSPTVALRCAMLLYHVLIVFDLELFS